jgi:hypothetical protein
MAMDLKLVSLIDKIETICKEADVGGFVTLTSRDKCEFRIIPPSWTAVRDVVLNDGTKAIRLKWSKQTDSQETAALTAFFVMVTTHTISAAAKWFGSIANEITKKWDVDKMPFGDFRPTNVKDDAQ